MKTTMCPVCQGQIRMEPDGRMCWHQRKRRKPKPGEPEMIRCKGSGAKMEPKEEQ